MNSSQRRKLRRKFKHVVPFLWNDNRTYLTTERIIALREMLEWCHCRYGDNGYYYQWQKEVVFAFATQERAMEFKLAWA